MRGGFKVYDADTHVMPVAEVLGTVCGSRLSAAVARARRLPGSRWWDFPNSIDFVLGWSSLKAETRQKLLWDNATRFYKQT